MANLTWALAGGGTARRTVGDEDPRRRWWLVAEGGDTRSGRLGDASNGPRWTRRSTGWRLLAPAGLQRAARRRTEGAAVVRRKGALGVVWRESERGAGGLYGVRRVRERDGSGWRRDERGVVARRKRKCAARPSGRTAGRLKTTLTGGPGVSAEERRGRIARAVRTERSDRATRRWAGGASGTAQAGKGERGRPGRRKEKEREGKKDSAQGEILIRKRFKH